MRGFPFDRQGQAFSEGTHCDLLDYAELRVPGLAAENRSRRGPWANLRAPLLAQIRQSVERRQAESGRPGRGSDVAFAMPPRSARRGRSVGTSADLRDFEEMHVESLLRECRLRGLSVQGLRHDFLRRVQIDVELHERDAARSASLA